MTISNHHLIPPHTLQGFDSELNLLHSLTRDMAGLVMCQFDQAMQALDEGDTTLAEQVIARDQHVDQYEIKIDIEVLEVLARHAPVANDLRTVITTSKLAVELAKVGDEIAGFAKLIAVLFNPYTSDPNPRLLADIVKIGNLVRLMLKKIMLAFDKSDASQAYVLLQYDRDCEQELQEGIRHQLTFVVQDARLMGRALDIMQIMKALESCGEHCRNMAEYLIFMLEGIDVRHRRYPVEDKLL